MWLKKLSIIKEIIIVDALQACESTCHEGTSKDVVENHKEDIAVEKEKLFLKKDMQN